MDRNALDWLFSTSPQAIAALVGLILAGVSFIYGKIDDRIEAVLPQFCWMAFQQHKIEHIEFFF